MTIETVEHRHARGRTQAERMRLDAADYAYVAELEAKLSSSEVEAFRALLWLERREAGVRGAADKALARLVAIPVGLVRPSWRRDSMTTVALPAQSPRGTIVPMKAKDSAHGKRPPAPRPHHSKGSAGRNTGTR